MDRGYGLIGIKEEMSLGARPRRFLYEVKYTLRCLYQYSYQSSPYGKDTSHLPVS